MKCSKCGAEFSGKFCPECGTGVGKAKRKKPFFLRWWFILLVIIVVGVVALSMESRKTVDDYDDWYKPTVNDTSSTEDGDEKENNSQWEKSDSENESSDGSVDKTEDKTEDTKPSESVKGLSPDFKATMDSYERFMGEYVDFMKKYKANPTDISLLLDYADYMKKYAEFTEDFGKWDGKNMNTEETSYYIDVQARVNKKLLEVVDK